MSIQLKNLPFYNKYFFSTNKPIEIWVIFSLTIFLLGFFIFPSSSKHNTFFYLSVCIPTVLLFLPYYKKLKFQNALIIATLFFSFYLFLNSLWSIHYTSNQSLKYLRYLFTLFCLFSAVYLTHYKKPQYSTLLFPAFVITGFFHSLYGIYNHFHGIPAPLTFRYSDPIDSAMLVGLLLLTCIWLAIESKAWKQKILYFFLSIPFIIIIFLSKSRGPQLALLLSFPLIAYYQKQYIKKICIVTLILLASLSAILVFTDMTETVFSRGVSAPYRMDIWSTSLKESFEHFWFGQGASHRPPLNTAKGQFNHSHNILLSIFRMGGVIAVLLFSTQIFLCFFSGQKNKKPTHRLWIVWLFFGLICLMTNGKYPLSRPSSAWLAYWIPVAFICASYSHFLSTNNEKNIKKP